MLARTTALLLLAATALCAPAVDHVARQDTGCTLPADCLTDLSTCLDGATGADLSGCLGLATCPIDSLTEIMACIPALPTLGGGED